MKCFPDEIKKCDYCHKYIEINKITCCIKGERIYLHPRCHKKVRPLLNIVSRFCSLQPDST